MKFYSKSSAHIYVGLLDKCELNYTNLLEVVWCLPTNLQVCIKFVLLLLLLFFLSSSDGVPEVITIFGEAPIADYTHGFQQERCFTLLAAERAAHRGHIILSGRH
ncbi:hypothetical protein DM860_014283 [Cuscuta australis]|uniref:Uncharacterized protein n=1 Tax=Cuscuta australis TaxID=267555 RepID=A0A328DD46_9ASTE|nr:hypothetical protein DM860_014283 [Cuscuta australis]